MSFVIQGPFPDNTTVVVLPSPIVTNTEGLRATVQTIRMMDGSARTYVKRKSGRKLYRWEFDIAVVKAREVEDYIISNAGALAQVSWKSDTYIGYLTLNPLEMRGAVGEFFRITIEFEEKS